MSVVIVDHGLCNVGSVRRALEECGGRVIVSEEPADTRRATHVVLPGVGAFAAGMEQLRSRGWDEALRLAAHEGIPILGICLGMQLLADHGTEGGPTNGLGLVPGVVEKIVPHGQERLPHVGWNEVSVERASPLFGSIPSGTDFYFVHSYCFRPRVPDDLVATVPYGGGGVAAAVVHERVFGVQFHPEKSSRAGFQLIKNFLAA